MALTSFRDQQKNLAPARDEVFAPWYHPDSAAAKAATLVRALTGTPGANYFVEL